ncbi:PREDICTED: extracellular signal-regulated kinase 1 [Papilio polytes]|uniref:extracellular signal-regulated kinase 1 n=1 Tax=Papilio polytes TaxID=76194 RepID=UPI0006769EC3|nr:PREDICTED: extracellular signal-regulated kinase 1 [Papilio polytes]
MSQTIKKEDQKKKECQKQTQKKSPEKNMSEIDEHILKRFEIKKRLGKGAYGIVWKATDKKTKDVVAIKKIFDAFRNQTDAQRTFREIIFLQSFRNHPNIVKLHSIHKALNNRDIYLGFEYMETDLHNVIKRGNILKDIHKRYIMYQMLKATKYIHSGNVIHRDQKPSNVLIDSACRVKLADFGLARSVSSVYSGGEEGADPCLTDYVATRWYRAPEILIASKKFHRERDEPTLPSDVLLPLRDDKQMSVDDYRNKLYSIMAKGSNGYSHMRKSQSSKTHTAQTSAHANTKTSKSFHEPSEITRPYKPKQISVSADQKTRPKIIKGPERPLKEYRSDQTITKPVRAPKLMESRSHDWETNCHGDYLPIRKNQNDGYVSGGKKIMQQRRNSTSFSTISIGGDADYLGRSLNQRHGVITASALIDLHTSIR